MANVNSISTNSNSYTSSIYGNRNILSGLATGMDTESMIENSVSGYKTKISQLQQQQEQLTWKQDAYRGITDQLIALSEKYTSYASSTNLSSNAFFTRAVTTTANGTYASKISASGKATSDIQINSVSQLATAARYMVGAGSLNFSADALGAVGSAIDWNPVESSTFSGSYMTLKVGSTSYDIDFGADDIYHSAQELLDGINKKLEDQNANARATISGNKISFEVTGDAAAAGDGVYILSASTSIKNALGVKTPTSSAATDAFTNAEYKSFTVANDSDLYKTQSAADYLSGKTVSVTLDGVSKSVTIGDLTKMAITVNGEEKTVSELSAEELTANSDKVLELLKNDLQNGMNTAFGRGKITVSANADGGLSFDVDEKSGSTLIVGSTAGQTLGLGKNGLTNYLNTGKTLGALLGESYFAGEGAGKLTINGVDIGDFTKDSSLEEVMSAINNNTEAGVSVSYSNLTGQFVFTARESGAAGEIRFGDGLASRMFEVNNAPENLTLERFFGDSIQWNEDGKAKLIFNSITAADASLGEFSKDDKVEDFLAKLGSIKRGAFKDLITYDASSGAYQIKDGNYLINAQGQEPVSLSGMLSGISAGGTFTAGKDAKLTATVNGQEVSLTRSSNVVSMDGLTVTLKGTFEASSDDEAVTFTTNSDADKIVDTLKGFVESYNAILKDVREAYSTRPLTMNTKGDKYMPLTDDDKSSMSESAIKSYEEKAKTGLLFGDSDLSALYTRLQSIVTSSDLGLASIGITTTYTDGVTQLSLNEADLRSALDSDPDKVKNIFTQTKENGSPTSGLMERFKSVFNTYASKSYGSYGILVNKAGTKLASLSLTSNSMQKQIDNLDKQIESWQTKLSNRIDYYTKQFTALEQMMSTMNNQSSMLATMMGY